MIRIWKTGGNWSSLVVSMFTPKDARQLSRRVFCMVWTRLRRISTHLNASQRNSSDASRCLVWILLYTTRFIFYCSRSVCWSFCMLYFGFIDVANRRHAWPYISLRATKVATPCVFKRHFFPRGFFWNASMYLLATHLHICWWKYFENILLPH